MSFRLRRSGVMGAGLLLLAGSAAAGEWSVALGGGVVDPNDFPYKAAYWTAVARARPQGTPVAVDLEVGYWSASWEWSSNEFGAYFYDRMAQRDLHFGLNVLAETPGKARVSIGGGFGPHVVRVDSTQTEALEYQPEANHSWTFAHTHTKLGIHALVGLDVAVSGRLGLFANARYDLLKGEAQTEVKLYGGVRLIVAKSAPAPPAEPPLSSRLSDAPHSGPRR